MNHLKRKYLDFDEVLRLKMEKAQGGRCAICRKRRTLVVDHDHVTRRVRGLLCLNCNVMLGHAKDDPKILTAGAAYLK